MKAGLAVLTVAFAMLVAGCFWLREAYIAAEHDHLERTRRVFLIEQGIQAHDPSVSVFATDDGHGHLDLVIRGVFDTKRQDRIVAWAKSAKLKNQIPGPVIISFQKEIPHSSQPDIILREVEI
jgi:hypothetical protein